MADLQHIYDNFPKLQANINRVWSKCSLGQIKLVGIRILDISLHTTDVVTFIEKCKEAIERIMSTSIYDTAINIAIHESQIIVGNYSASHWAKVNRAIVDEMHDRQARIDGGELGVVTIGIFDQVECTCCEHEKPSSTK